MRNELKNFEWFTYGLTSDDFDYIIRLINEMIDSRIDIYKQHEVKVKNENPEFADDALDDIAYYVSVDIEYMWEFCLWRLQGIFEGIITTRFLSNIDQKIKKSLIGLKSKLDKMKEEGFAINIDDYNELLEWGRLRNALSHCPPEQYRPIALGEDDINDYVSLVKKVISVWDKSI
jgi:hypothetical protein